LLSGWSLGDKRIDYAKPKRISDSQDKKKKTINTKGRVIPVSV
jgi:hypothetical protein